MSLEMTEKTSENNNNSDANAKLIPKENEEKSKRKK